jgi:tripartite-type tricarboxylate transporter receptor subunit TctC
MRSDTSRAMRRSSIAAPLLLAWFAAAGPVLAQTGAGFPNRPFKIVVPFPAGGPVDLTARTLAPKLAAALGQPVVVDNRAGAATIIGTDAVAKSPADGYTWLVTTNGIAINPSVYKKLPYDTLGDLLPVMHISNSPFILVAHPSLPVRSAADLIKLAKARPGELMYSSSGIGSANHLSVALLNIMAGINTTHVPYKGTVPSLSAAVAGEVHFQFSNPIASGPLARAGKLRALGTGGTRRLPTLPELPTIAESGIAGFQAGPWFGMFAPAGTPRDIVKRMHGDMVKILAMPEVRQTLSAEGAELITETPEQFAAFVKTEIAKWAKVVEFAQVKAD